MADSTKVPTKVPDKGFRSPGFWDRLYLELLFAAHLLAVVTSVADQLPPPDLALLRPDGFRHYLESFNRLDRETVVNHIPNAAAWDWLVKNVPLLECPDKDLEEIYYFRWWTYRKHIKQTPDGFIITEFLPPVPWGGKHNSINCAAGHHFYEGRWLHDAHYLDDYAVFWFRKGGEPRKYSFWAADAIYARSLVLGDFRLPKELLPDLIANYEAWEKSHLDASGLYWQNDGNDGMEVSIGGSGRRATINSYQYRRRHGHRPNRGPGRPAWPRGSLAPEGRRAQAARGGKTLGPGGAVLQGPASGQGHSGRGP